VKFKIKQQQAQTIVRIEISRNEELITRELNNLIQTSMRGLFVPHLKKGHLLVQYVLEYTAPHSISIMQYLQNTISKRNFHFILAQIVALVNGLKLKNMSLNNLVLDMRYVFINPNTKELNFLYVPVLSGQVSTDVLAFIRSILQSANPDANENTKYFSDFSAFCASQERFSVESFRNYLVKQDKGAAAILKNLMIGQSGFMTNKRYEYVDHYQERDDEFGSSDSSDDDGTTLLSDNGLYADYADDEGTALLDEEGTALLTEDEGTTLLDQGFGWNSTPKVRQHYPYLIRCSTGERIEINKPAFRLGKERQYVDYFITNNNAVSRSHADIVTRGNRYFVVDLNTTNYTYINGRIIPPNSETELFDGNILKLANEEFEFHVQ